MNPKQSFYQREAPWEEAKTPISSIDVQLLLLKCSAQALRIQDKQLYHLFGARPSSSRNSHQRGGAWPTQMASCPLWRGLQDHLATAPKRRTGPLKGTTTPTTFSRRAHYASVISLMVNSLFHSKWDRKQTCHHRGREDQPWLQCWGVQACLWKPRLLEGDEEGHGSAIWTKTEETACRENQVDHEFGYETGLANRHPLEVHHYQ